MRKKEVKIAGSSAATGSGQGGEATWEGFRKTVNIHWVGIMHQVLTRYFLYIM